MNPLSVLLEGGLISQEIATTIQTIVDETGKSYEEAILESGVTPDALRNFFAEYYQVPTETVGDGFTIDEKVLSYIQEESAVHYKIIPLRVDVGGRGTRSRRSTNS